MTASSSPNELVAYFARLCAALDDGFAARGDVLAAVGFDEVSPPGTEGPIFADITGNRYQRATAQ
jgi:hypothetical protein